MPDALERYHVLAWFSSKASCADKHSNAIVCQAISGDVIGVCLLIALSKEPPNRRLQRTRFA